MMAIVVVVAALIILLLWMWLRQVIEARNEGQLQLGLFEGQLKALRFQIEESVGLTNQLMEAVADPLLVLDTRQRILMSNPAAEGIWGKHLIGETLIGATRNYDLDMLARESVQNTEEPLDTVISIGNLTFQARAVLVAGNHTAVQILILRDITELRSLGRARKEMVVNVSHELRTPITAIGLLADTLLDMEITADVRDLLTNIRHQNQILTQLAEEMRDLSQIESGQMPIRLMPIDLKQLMIDSAKPVETLARDKNHTLTLDPPQAIEVLADFQAMQRALKNIIHNAVKFCPPKSKICVSATVKGDEALIKVEDNGPGIAAEDLSRIFERFFQGDRSRSDGTGLGLAIARHIVKAHGGKIWVESEEGLGATFFITLPLALEDDAEI